MQIVEYSDCRDCRNLGRDKKGGLGIIHWRNMPCGMDHGMGEYSLEKTSLEIRHGGNQPCIGVYLSFEIYEPRSRSLELSKTP